MDHGDRAQKRSFSHIPYLSEQIIPYIGNKRGLLPLIFDGLSVIFPDGFRGKTFCDPFAGSGIVSRFAKYLGFKVYANDWEYYAYVLNFAYLTIDKRDLYGMYPKWDGIVDVLAHLNTLPPPKPEDEYIARYYCPQNDAQPDYRRERLFYTRYNGLIIDTVRNEIERLYPEGLKGRNELLYREKMLLLALLIHQAATYTNTSGVFKAYHKGFGGFSGDALSRILKPIALPHPVLIDSNQHHLVFSEDANKLLDRETFKDTCFDVAYIDPPYNQHQYGSNYHLLNTVAYWDRVPLDTHRGKAGIRKDWVTTRSAYCYQDQASRVFGDLLSRLKARHIIISYSTEGMIPFQQLIDICSENGKVRLITNEYVKYRGGKQSIYRLNNNIEFIIIIDTMKKTGSADRQNIEDIVTARELNLQLKKSYVKAKLQNQFPLDELGERVGFRKNGEVVWIKMRGFFKIDEYDLNEKVEGMGWSYTVMRDAKRKLLEKLKRCECQNKIEELHQILNMTRAQERDMAFFISLIPNILRKVAHKKYKKLFFLALKDVRSLKQRLPEAYGRIEGRVEEVVQLALKRFSG